MLRRPFWLLLYIAILAIPFVLDHVAALDEQNTCLPHEERPSKLAPVGYRHLSRAGYRLPRSRVVRVVMLKEHVEPRSVLTNLCEQRAFLAKLIKRLEGMDPALIVLDKYFSPNRCPEGDEGTKLLFDAIQNRKVPIVVGLQTDILPDIELQETGQIPRACLILANRLEFSEGSVVTPLKFGLTRLNSDTSKIPLEWEVFDKGADVRNRMPKTLPTLSIVAAEQFDHGLGSNEALEYLLRAGKHPFTSFIPTGDIRTYSALALLCKDTSQGQTDWQHCDPSDDPLGDDLRGKIVVVGDWTNPGDQHPSMLGVVPGIVLQANYIEALLDDRFFKPVPGGWIFVIYLLWLGVVCLIFAKVQTPELAVLVCLGIALVFLGASYAVLVEWRYFLNIWFQGGAFLLIVARWAEERAYRARERGQASAPGAATPASH